MDADTRLLTADVEQACTVIRDLLKLLDQQERTGSDLECEGGTHEERCPVTRALAFLRGHSGR